MSHLTFNDCRPRRRLYLLTMLGLFLAIVMPMLQPEVLFLNAAEVISHLTSISPYSAVALLYTAKYFLDGALLLLFVRYAEKEKLNSVGIKRVTFFDAISALATCLLAFSVNSFGIHFWSSQAVQHSNQGRHLFLLLPRTLRLATMQPLHLPKRSVSTPISLNVLQC